MSSIEKIVASAPKLMPVVVPAIKGATPVIAEGLATAAGGVLSVISSPLVLTGIGIFAAYKIAKKVL